ncbi:MAG: glucose 1-dehydrogenase [bacterium]|nr:3-alpha-hydroxysteroid dehydrogenase [Deltaproteobacteria bacterium]MCP4903847.1 glucose 1-dehydrogenase [bacterium]
MNRLAGKVALITGGARGQGEAEARIFAAEGAKVVIADVLDEAGAKVASEIGEAARYLHLDVTNEDGWADVVKETVATFGRLDILINNAGIVRTGYIEQHSLEDFMAVVNVNQVGVFLGIRAVVAPMRESGGGSIVNISSNAGLEGVEGVVGYVASKWAVRGMTKTAAIEFGQYGIRVNSVHPGGVDTPMLGGDELGHMAESDPFQDQPIGRISQPEEIARLVLFLASDESSYSTGSEFTADGGRMAGHRDRGLVAE